MTFERQNKNWIGTFWSQVRPLVHSSAAAAGEVVACLVRVPVEVVKQRAQSTRIAPISILTDIFKREGTNIMAANIIVLAFVFCCVIANISKRVVQFYGKAHTQVHKWIRPFRVGETLQPRKSHSFRLQNRYQTNSFLHQAFPVCTADI